MDTKKEYIDELVGALIGLAKSCENNPIGETTTQIIIEGLFMTIDNKNVSCNDLEMMIENVHKEKYRIVPNCSHCASPCGNTSDFDLKKLNDVSEDIRTLKLLLLFGIKQMAADAYQAKMRGFEDKSAEAFLYKALFFIGYDAEAEAIKNVISEMEQLRLQYK